MVASKGVSSVYLINKTIGSVLNPLGFAIFLLVCACAWTLWKRSVRPLVVTTLVCAAWLWVWGTNVWSRVVGLPLERGLTLVKAEDAPVCDAIVLLGGGMSASPGAYPYPDMHDAADRVWHAARLYKAGKAPIIIPTGLGDRESTEPLLLDLGVPQTAIVGEYAARNTEENARFVAKTIKDLQSGTNAVAKTGKILLVTSAWHMRRSVLMYTKYAPDLEVVPAPADFTCTVACAKFEFKHLLPHPDDFYRNCGMAKELIGYWGYRLLR